MNAVSKEDLTEDQFQGYISIPYGPQVTAEYLHSSKHCDLQDVVYNSKTHDYIILDSRGISSWHPTCVTSTIKRAMEFEAYKFNILRCLCYSRYHNLYFALTKYFGIKVYNLNFHEICHQEGDGDSISKLLYNNKENELIAVCRNKIKFWKYAFKEMQPSVVFQREFEIVESVVLSSAKFDENAQRIYLMCDTDIFGYTLSGKQLFCLRGPHSIAYFCACTYSEEANLMVAGSINGELSIYSPNGGLVTTMINHSKIITALVIHPKDGTMFISSSLDGTIKVFSLQMLGEIYSMPVFKEGILFMRVHGTNSLFAASHKGVQTFDLNCSFKFWSTSRAPVRCMSVTPPIVGLRQYVVVSTADNSIRLFSKHTGQRRTTVLPPPEIPIGYDVLSVTFDRQGRAMYILFKPLQLWIYSTRTDPATRVATWDLNQTIKQSREGKTSFFPENGKDELLQFGASHQSQKQAEANITCCSLLAIKREVFNTESLSDKEFLNFGYLMCGLSNGLIYLLDPCQRGRLVKSFKAHSTSPVVDMCVDYMTTKTNLLTVINTIDGVMVRIWDVINLECSHQMFFYDDYTQFVFKNLRIVVGYSSGHIHTEASFQNDMDKGTHDMLKSSQMKEHDGTIMSLDLSGTREIFCSVGSDNFVRVWNFSKVLLIEIKFDNTLKYALFLSRHDEILISFKSQLFIIPQNIVFQKCEIPTNNQLDEDSSGDESFIFEDPFVCKQNLRQPNNASINLASYLVPYPNLGLETLWMFNKALGEFDDIEESDSKSSVVSDSSSDSFNSFASTTLYQDSDNNEDLDAVGIQFPSCFSTPEPLQPSEARLSEKESLKIVVDDKEKEDQPVVNEKGISDQTSDTVAKPSNEVVQSLYERIRTVTTVISQKTSVLSNEKYRKSKPVPLYQSTSNVTKGNSIPKTSSLSKKKPRQKKDKKSKAIKTRSQNIFKQSQSKITIQKSDFKASKVTELKATGSLPLPDLAKQSCSPIITTPVSITILSTDNQPEQKNSLEVLEGTNLDLPIDYYSPNQSSSEDLSGSNTKTTNHHSLLSMALGKSANDTISGSYRNVLESLFNTPNVSNTCSPIPTTPVIISESEEETSPSPSTTSHHDARSAGLTTKKSKVTDRPSFAKINSEKMVQSSVSKQLKNKQTLSSHLNNASQHERKSIKAFETFSNKSPQESKSQTRPSTSAKDRTKSFSSTTVLRPASVKFNKFITEFSSGDESLISDTSETELTALYSNIDINEIQPAFDDENNQSHPEELFQMSQSRTSYSTASNNSESVELNAKSQAVKAFRKPAPSKRKRFRSMPKKHSMPDIAKADSDSYFASVILNKRKQSLKNQIESREKNRKHSGTNENEVIKVEFRPSQTDLHTNVNETTDTQSIAGSDIDHHRNQNHERRLTTISNDDGHLNKNILMISPVKGIDPNNNQESPVVNNNEENQQIMKYIVSSFRKPTSPTKNERVQLRHNNGKKVRKFESDYVSTVDFESTSRPLSTDMSGLSLRPTSCVSSIVDSPSNDFSPVSQVVVRCTSTAEPDSDESSTSNTTPLKDRLKKYRKSKQKQKERTESVRIRQSAMSGYESASMDSLHQSSYMSRVPRTKDRLTIKQRPLSKHTSMQMKNIHSNQQRNSEAVYFDDYLKRTHRHNSKSPQRFTNNKQILIENLEKKVSGQKHRYHVFKPEHQMEADQLALSILKNNSGVKVPVSRSSSSIPNRAQYQSIKTSKPGYH